MTMNLAEVIISIWVLSFVLLFTYSGGQATLSVLTQASLQEDAIFVGQSALFDEARSLERGTIPPASQTLHVDGTAFWVDTSVMSYGSHLALITVIVAYEQRGSMRTQTYQTLETVT